MPRELSTLVVQSIITNIMSKVSIFKIRIIKAIKNGNNEEQYIIEACNERDVLYHWNDYHKAIQQLVNEGKIMYNKTIEGYVLLCNQ